MKSKEQLLAQAFLRGAERLDLAYSGVRGNRAWTRTLAASHPLLLSPAFPRWIMECRHSLPADSWRRLNHNQTQCRGTGTGAAHMAENETVCAGKFCVYLCDASVPLVPSDKCWSDDGQVYVVFEGATSPVHVGNLSDISMAGLYHLEMRGSGNGNCVPVTAHRVHDVSLFRSWYPKGQN